MKPDNLKFHDFFLKTSLRNVSLSIAISGIVLILTISATIYTKRYLETQAKYEFERVCNEIKTKIYSRLYTQSLLLQSCSSYISASDSITRDDWKFFIENSMVFQNMFGYQGIAYNVIIPKRQLKQPEINSSKEKVTNCPVYPDEERDTYTSIIYIEPLSKENLRAIGYDTYSEPIRRRAMEYARDFNLSALTGKLTLVQENQVNKQAGIIMYTPVYKRNMPINNVKERRTAIIGWVSCPYRMDGLMMNILGPWGLDNNNSNKIHLVIYDNDSISSGSILYDSRKNETDIHDDISIQIRLNPVLFNEKSWTLKFSQSKEQYSYFKGKVLVVLICGSVVSLLLLGLSFILFTIHRRARQIADN
jgi:CHASE1-domain containing sensor protein